MTMIRGHNFKLDLDKRLLTLKVQVTNENEEIIDDYEFKFSPNGKAEIDIIIKTEEGYWVRA